MPVPDPLEPDTVLGDWTANLVRVGRTQVVLAISERTLLPIVLPAREGRTLARRLAEAIEPVLLLVGIPAEAARAELEAMQDAVIAKTASRRVLGSLKELSYHLEGELHYRPDRTLLDHARALAETPMKLIDYGSPNQATIAAFAARQVLQRAAGR